MPLTMMKTIIRLIIITSFLNMALAKNIFDIFKKPKIVYRYKLYHHWFNELGGLDFLQGYALLTIDENGGISLEDKFKDPSHYLKSHWVEIDEIDRTKNNEIFIFASFHSNPEMGKNQGNGGFKFPSSGKIHVVKGASPLIQIRDNQEFNENQFNQESTENLILKISGEIKVKRNGKWIKARKGMNIEIGDEIDTGNNKATIVISNKGYIELYPHTVVIRYRKHKTSLNFLKLIKGFLWARIPKGKDDIKYATPNAIIGVRGTEFKLSAKNGISCVEVIKGFVSFTDINGNGSVIVNEGEESCVVDDSAPFPPTPVREKFKVSVSGTWTTNFGELKLTQQGNLVVGTYTHDEGKLKGVLLGDKLMGIWSEAPSYKPLYNAGECILIFSRDGKTFSGHWKYGYKGNWNGKWNGKRK